MAITPEVQKQVVEITALTRQLAMSSGQLSKQAVALDDEWLLDAYIDLLAAFGNTLDDVNSTRAKMDRSISDLLAIARTN